MKLQVTGNLLKSPCMEFKNQAEGLLKLQSITECVPKLLSVKEELSTEKDFVTEALEVQKESWSDQ